MATKFCEGENSPAVHGNETDEYKKVLVNLDKIVEALKANEGAKDSLYLKCTMKEWTELTANPNEVDLLRIILNRIKDDIDMYYEFMDMLGNIPSLKLVKKRIEETKCKYIIPADIRVGRLSM